MADKDNGNPMATDTSAADNSPRASIINQYVKDLSFENPNAYDVFKAFAGSTPKIDVAIDINGIKKTPDTYEVELKFTISSKKDETGAFLIELIYAGLFAIKNISDEQIQPFLHIQAPFVLFPFARRVIADVTRDGGYPPLMLDPIDFGSLYQQRLAHQAARKTPTANA